MADNTTLNAGSGGDVIASDDIAGVKYQRVKLSVGADGSAADAASGGGTEAGALRVTVASDSTGVLSVDDNGGSLTVDVGTALPAGTNAIGKLAANSGVDIGDVDVTSVVPGTGATNLGKAEDAAHVSGDTGVLALAVRQDADASSVSATGDYSALQVDANGYLKVNIKAGSSSGGTALTDAAAFTRATTSVTPVAGVVETSAPTLTNGNAGALSLTTGGAVRVAVASGGVAGIAEDSAAAGGEEGIMMLAVRRDSASSGVSADGDFAALSVTSDGSLRVSGGGGGTQYAVDTAAGATDTGTLALLVRDDALATLTPVDGDYTQGRTNARGALWVALDSTAAQTVTLAAETTKVIGTVNLAAAQTLATVTNLATIGTSVTPGTSAAHLGKAEDAAHASGDTGVMVLAVRQDTQATLASATGDYVPFTSDSVGSLYVRNTNELADDSAFTVATSRVSPTGFLADETATDSVDEGDIGIGRMTLDRKQVTAQYAHTAGGWTPSHTVSAASTNATSLKGSAGQVGFITASNVNAAMRYLKLYNKATAPTVGTDTPVLVLPIPGNTAGAGIALSFGPGIEFTTGIAWALTTGAANSDTGAVSASEHVIGIGYK